MSKIAYTDNNKYAWFMGIKFTRDDRTGYYLNSTNKKRLHRAVWEYHNIPIPSGFDIHHIDQDRGNNDISNLKLIESVKHKTLHGKERAINDKEWLERFNKKGREQAKYWHKSKEGKEWHKKHYEGMKGKLHTETEIICKHCGEKSVTKNQTGVFCSNKCKSAWRRKEGIDNEVRECGHCGAAYEANKYTKRRFCSTSCSNRAIPRLPQLRCS